MKPEDRGPVGRFDPGCDSQPVATVFPADSVVSQKQDSRAAVNRALEEMRRQWAADHRLGAEEFLAALPPGSPTEQIVDLIYGELLLRQECGEAIDAHSFFERFPKYRRELERQFEFDAVVAATIDNEAQTTHSTSSAVRHPLLAGKAFPQLLGKYVLIAPLDSGGQAEVYLALHQGLRMEVVVKLGLYALDEHCPRRNRLLEEGRILARLEHRSLARVYDLDLHEGHPYVVMEYVRGMSLDHYHRQTPLTPSGAAVVVAKLARAVAYSHRLQVLHLDIKPKNVLVEADGEPRLIDFGLAQLNDVWTETPETGGISGTLQFMAPEQASLGKKDVGPAADIYALGGLLYFLLTRHSPHEGDSVEELLENISANRWQRELLDDKAIPRRLRRICVRAMATDPEDRYANADDLAGELEQFARGGKRRRFIAGAVLLICVALVVFGWFAYFRPSPPLGQPQLAAEVWQEDSFLPIEEQLPLVRGDEVRFRGALPPECHGALFHFDSEGNWHCLQRWRSDAHAKTVMFPPAGQALPLEGAAGTEVIVLCVSREPLSLDELDTAWPAGQPLAPLKPYALGHFDPQRGVWLENHSKAFGTPQQRDDPDGMFMQRMAALASKLSAAEVQYRGVGFFHR